MLHVDFADLYQSHIQNLIADYQQLMSELHYDHLVIPSGEPIRKFQDDMDYPFKANPQFKALLPLTSHPYCYVILPRKGRPQLVFFQPVDFWHQVPDLPTEDWINAFDVHVIIKPDQAQAFFPKGSSKVALLGEESKKLHGYSFDAVNPQDLMARLNWRRSYKSEYEIACMRRSNQVAAKAHNAARDAFYAGGSELDIHLAYLKAGRMKEEETPYGSIVALNEHSAILHYTGCDREPLSERHRRSFLIDAGAQVHGYASDITRTYSYKQDEFADLISAVDEKHLALVAGLKPGVSYVDAHVQAHHDIGDILQRFGFVNMAPESQVEAGITSTFFPHGLGHYIGLLTHDVGGHQANVEGDVQAPPAAHPFLRLTRKLEASQVITVEPGLYFIDSLLAELKQGKHGNAINWQKVDAFRPYGGIRIEDDILITETGNENFSRAAFAELSD